jgi:hypothetical protein
MKIIVMVVSILLFGFSGQAQSKENCRVNNPLSKERNKASHEVFQYMGFTQVCLVEIDTTACSSACNCAYETFKFLIEVNPQNKELLSKERVNFFSKFAQQLECPMF